ncbi:hypothetical protein CSUI_001918, partial [Cystoisospora suis]
AEGGEEKDSRSSLEPCRDQLDSLLVSLEVFRSGTSSSHPDQQQGEEATGEQTAANQNTEEASEETPAELWDVVEGHGAGSGDAASDELRRRRTRRAKWRSYAESLQRKERERQWRELEQMREMQRQWTGANQAEEEDKGRVHEEAKTGTDDGASGDREPIYVNLKEAVGHPGDNEVFEGPPPLYVNVQGTGEGLQRTAGRLRERLQAVQEGEETTKSIGEQQETRLKAAEAEKDEPKTSEKGTGALGQLRGMLASSVPPHETPTSEEAKVRVSWPPGHQEPQEKTESTDAAKKPESTEEPMKTEGGGEMKSLGTSGQTNGEGTAVFPKPSKKRVVHMSLFFSRPRQQETKPEVDAGVRKEEEDEGESTKSSIQAKKETAVGVEIDSRTTIDEEWKEFVDLKARVAGTKQTRDDTEAQGHTDTRTLVSGGGEAHETARESSDDEMRTEDRADEMTTTDSAGETGSGEASGGELEQARQRLAQARALVAALRKKLDAAQAELDDVTLRERQILEAAEARSQQRARQTRSRSRSRSRTRTLSKTLMFRWSKWDKGDEKEDET